jgi:aryl-alcohol dehydrogenase-like predicted oxidoreductase
MVQQDHRQERDSTRRSARRQFLGAAGLVTAGGALGLEAITATPSVPSESNDRAKSPPRGADAGTGEIPERPLGRTGVKVSALGMGGHHLGGCKTVEEAIQLVHEAVDAGITFYDNCWEYWNGRAEDWLGRGLKGRRDKVFLMTKVCTHGRGADLAMKMLDESLRRLQTDYLDLWQIHGVGFDNEPELAYAKGGVLEALDEAKKLGKVRFVGFTGHKDPSIHLDMIRRGYPFDTVQMPLNCLDATFRSFEKHVLPELNKRGIAALGMKSMGGSAPAVKSGLVKAEEMLRYAMSLPVATTIAGMDSSDVLHQNLRIARGFKPMTAEEMQALRDRCAKAAGDGRYEVYKLSLRFDNPQARLPHGFPLDITQKEVREMLFEEAGGP